MRLETTEHLMGYIIRESDKQKIAIELFITSEYETITDIFKKGSLKLSGWLTLDTYVEQAEVIGKAYWGLPGIIHQNITFFDKDEVEYQMEISLKSDFTKVLKGYIPVTGKVYKSGNYLGEIFIKLTLKDILSMFGKVKLSSKLSEDEIHY